MLAQFDRMGDSLFGFCKFIALVSAAIAGVLVFSGEWALAWPFARGAMIFITPVLAPHIAVWLYERISRWWTRRRARLLALRDHAE